MQKNERKLIKCKQKNIYLMFFATSDANLTLFLMKNRVISDYNFTYTKIIILGITRKQRGLWRFEVRKQR
jgi:hypothetical protein